MAFAPQEGLLAVAESGFWRRPGNVVLWNLEDGGLVQKLIGHTKAINSVAFSPDGRRLATASFDQTVRVWDVRSGQSLRTLKSQGDPLMDVAFNA